MKTLEKKKIDFSAPHITYRNKSGQAVVGTTTAIGKLAMPALPIWGFNTGKEPMYKSITQAMRSTKTFISKMDVKDAVRWGFNIGQQRKNSSLYGKRDKAGEIGTVAHEILRWRELGIKIDNSNIGSHVWELAQKCVASHDQWFKSMKMETVLLEEAYVSEKYQYGGTLDKLAIINGELTLIDYKTGKDIYDTNFIQLAAYTNLALENGHEVKNAIAVNIPKTKGSNFNIKSVDANTLFEAGYFDWFIAARDAYYAEARTKEYKEVL